MLARKSFFIVVFSIFWVFPFFSFAQGVDRDSLIQTLQRQVEELSKQIQTLQQQLQETRSELGVTVPIPTTPISTESSVIEITPTESIPDFTRTLSRGISGDDVRKLQEFLKKDKEIYPDGLITGYFGPKTEEALKKWQTKHNIEAVGILGPQTRARFQELGKGRIQELITEGAGASGQVPLGLLTAPGIQKKLEIPTTTPPSTATTTVENLCVKDPTKCYTEKTCKAQNYYWYNVSCHKEPPVSGSCSESNIFCINSTECSKGGYYWCRNSCYATSTACLGQTFVPPVQPAIPAVPATPAPPTSQTSTATVPATPATPAVPAIVATSTTTTSSCASLLPYSGSHASDITSTSAKINWDTFRVVTNEIRYSTSPFTDINSPNFTIVTSPLVSGTSYSGSPYYSLVISNLTPSTKYYYTIVMKESCGRTTNTPLYAYAYSFTTLAQSVSTTDIISPSIPNGLTATPAQYSITLNWNNSTDNVGVTGYKVYRDGTQVFSTTTSTSLATSSFTDWALTPSTSYSYTVAAYDASGNVSAQSSAVSATTVAVQTTTTTTTTTAAVSDLTATFYSNGFYVFSWKDNSGISSGASSNYYFYVYQKPQGGLPSLIYKQYNSATNFSYWYHPQGTYEYYVSLCNEITKSCVGTSNTVSVQVNIASSFPQCTGLTLTTNKSIYIVNEIGKYTVSCVPSNGRAVNVTVRYTNPNGQLIRPSPLTNIQKSTTDFGIHSVGNYIFEACLHPECQPSPEASLSVSAVAATTTSSTNLDTVLRLAQILESLNSILNSLKLLR